jgi:hypothetical protein
MMISLFAFLTDSPYYTQARRDVNNYLLARGIILGYIEVGGDNGNTYSRGSGKIEKLLKNHDLAVNPQENPACGAQRADLPYSEKRGRSVSTTRPGQGPEAEGAERKIESLILFA